MNKFRAKLFKLLTGYDLIDYHELLKLACEIQDLNQRINKDSRETIELVKEINNRCDRLTEYYENKIKKMQHKNERDEGLGDWLESN